MFSRAIVRRPGRSMIKGITTAGLGQPDYELALQQHDAYIEALESCGLVVTVMQAEEDYPDAMFVEDTAFVMPRCAIVTRPGAESRRGETGSIRKQLESFYQDVEIIESPGMVDAGDIMMVGEQVYIGLSERTNQAGADQMIEYLRKYGYRGSTIAISEGLHFKSSISYLEHNRIVVTGELCGKPELAHFEAIVIDAADAYSANSVWINDYVLVPAGYANTSWEIAESGYEVIELNVSEFQKLDGGLSCLSLRF
ncbi:MAG: N(G),N(G)-dimethylarginine dimethylaminohydrolase [Gammaproteobacteria bacterium]|nr:N(G),N(G)-dimethylarginine dimethylaminohydrolase [Gammaproteobacteria bacterium]